MISFLITGPVWLVSSKDKNTTIFTTTTVKTTIYTHEEITANITLESTTDITIAQETTIDTTNVMSAKNAVKASKEKTTYQKTNKTSKTTTKAQSSNKAQSSKLVFEGNISSELKNYSAKHYEKIPLNIKNKLKKDGWEVIVTTKNIANTYGRQFKHLGSIAGLIKYEEKKIYISARKNVIKKAIMHEVGHFVDLQNNYISSSEEFIKIFNEEKNIFKKNNNINNHNISSSTEFFAEVYSQAILHPQTCKSLVPKAYEFVIRYANKI